MSDEYLEGITAKFREAQKANTMRGAEEKMTAEERKALSALTDYTQADEDGVMVLVSRQAIHEVKAIIDRLSLPTPAVTRESADNNSQEYYLDQIADILDNERWSRQEHCNAIYDLFAHLLSGATVAVDREQHRFKTQAVIREAYKAWTPLKYDKRFDEYIYDALIASGLLGTKGEG